MSEAAAILARLDAIMAELAELRAAVAANAFKSEAVDLEEADDLLPEHLLDTTSAAARFGHPQDSIRKWCRTEGLGVRRGGRWMVSVPRLQKRINGK